MISNKDICVVIPVHSAYPSAAELISFRQCFKVLGSYPIKVLAPAGLPMRAYQQEVEKFNVVSVAPAWLSSKKQYNQLKKNRFFYKLFEGYDFLLTYELDAYVFKDELLSWGTKNYDYIGAPWFAGWTEPERKIKIIGVGNGGFSLRKTSTSLSILKRVVQIKLIYNLCLCNNKKDNSLFRFVMKGLKGYFNISNTHLLPGIVDSNVDNEDGFWCMLVGKTFKDYQIAPVEEAMKFSFEANPGFLFEQNNCQLPFGCHAWQRFDPLFWEKYINHA
jgi:hypothetical protein